MWYFSVGGGGKSVADIDTGAKSLHFDKFTMLSLLFLPPRGPNSIANFDGGPWPDLPPPWIRHCLCLIYTSPILIHHLLLLRLCQASLFLSVQLLLLLNPLHSSLFYFAKPVVYCYNYRVMLFPVFCSSLGRASSLEIVVLMNSATYNPYNIITKTSTTPTITTTSH